MTVHALDGDRALVAVARLLHGRRSKDSPMALLQAFFDESGTHGQARTTAIAGYVGTEGEWHKVQEEWQKALGARGIKTFHATSFYAQRDEFSSMDTPTRGALQRELAEAIQAGKLCAISVAVDAHAYAISTSERFRSVFPKPYDLCFNEIIRGINLWSEQEADGQEVGLVFAATGEYADRCHETFNNWKRYGHLKTVGGLQFQTPAKVPALQCADFLSNRLYAAWETLLMDESGDGQLLCDPVLQQINVGERDMAFMGADHLKMRSANANWHDPVFPCPAASSEQQSPANP